MVLIAAAICTKAGKAIISRQFVEMTKSRIEGLLSAFPKLMSTGKQHTFVETESVRYVYQPLEKLYMLLITTKASNILEDLETLRLFSRVIPEYCQSMEESEIIENAFNLIFAFDEIVALGYRESVNLAQIRTFVEMESHEEKVYQAVRQTQEREAKNKMREKAKELQRQRMEAAKKGIKSPGYGGSSSAYSSGSSFIPSSPSVGDSASSYGGSEPAKAPPSYSAAMKPSGPSRALKLGSKARDVESFVDQLKSEGENVGTAGGVGIGGGGGVGGVGAKAALGKVGGTPVQDMEAVHLRIEEKMQLSAGRDGGLHNMEVHGMVTLRITDEKFGLIRVKFDNKDRRGIQLQTHPNVDKELFKAKTQIGLKNSSKPFPINTDVGVLKWRFQTKDESLIPLTINCWPSENGQGGCDVNIEYELVQDDLELNDVSITISLASGSGSPLVNECDGEYTYDSRKNLLLWQLPLVDASNKSGAMEFSAGGIPSDFFPIQVSFVSKKSYAELTVVEVQSLEENDSPVKHSVETIFFTDKYEII